MLKRTLGVLFLVGLCGPVSAQTGVGPSMLNVKEIIVQFARIGNGKASDSCGVSREAISTVLVRTLKMDGVNAFASFDAPVTNPAIARLNLIPEIVTLYSSSGDCTSWVSLGAQTNSVAKIAPVETPRSIVVTYWRSGQLVTSGQSGHARIVTDLLQKLSGDFAKQYLVDQPPPMPSFDEKEAPKKDDPFAIR